MTEVILVKKHNWFAIFAITLIAGCAATRAPDIIPSGYMIFFEDGSSLVEGQSDLLNEVSLILAKFPETKVQMTGHRSSAEPKDVDELRVEAVAQQLLTLGVDRRRMVILTAEASAPVGTVSQGLDSGNRRIEMYIVQPRAN